MSRRQKHRPPPEYLAYHDAIGQVFRWYDGSTATYSKHPGDPNLIQEYEPGDLPDQESRGYWRFTIPDFTDKSVKDVKLEFRTRDAQCYPPPTCHGTLSFKVDVFRLYRDPNTATPQEIYDGIHRYRGLPYLKGARGEFTLQAHTPYSFSLGPNAIADINHHEGGWYALGMKIDEIRDGLNRLVWGRLEICSLSGCANPPGPGASPGRLRSSLAARPGPVPLYAVPVLIIVYDTATDWPQLHGDARHNGYSASLAPRSAINVWHARECDSGSCFHTAYSPVAKDGYVYSVVLNDKLRAVDYNGNPVATRIVPDSTTVPGAWSLAVNSEMVVNTGTTGTFDTFVHAFSPAPDLTPLWSYTISTKLNQAPPTLYGRYVLVGTSGWATEWGNLHLLESWGSTVSPVWTFTPPTDGDIFAPPAIHTNGVIVRTTTKLYSIPLVDPDGSGAIEADEVRWTFDLGAWGGPQKYDRGLNSGPAVKGGFAYVGSHNGAVHKISVESPDPPPDPYPAVWTYSAGPGHYVASTPGVGFGYVYVYVTAVGSSGTPTYVRAIDDTTGVLAWNRPFDNGITGRGSPSLADGKVFVWVGGLAPGGDVPVGAWTAVLETALTDGYWVQVGGPVDAEYPELGNTPALASSSPASGDGWALVGNGGLGSLPEPDPFGFINGWNG